MDPDASSGSRTEPSGTSGDPLAALMMLYLSCVGETILMRDSTSGSSQSTDLASASANRVYADSALANVTDAPTVLVCMIKATSSTGDILVLSPSTTGGTTNGLYVYMNMTPAVLLQPENPASYYTSVDIDWINSVNPDYIVFCGSGVYSTTDDEAGVQATFEELCSSIFGSTQAYKNGNIISTANGTMGSYLSGFAYLKLISAIFDEIDDSYADEVFNSWVSEGYVYYDYDDVPTYRIRVLGTS